MSCWTQGEAGARRGVGVARTGGWFVPGTTRFVRLPGGTLGVDWFGGLLAAASITPATKPAILSTSITHDACQLPHNWHACPTPPPPNPTPPHLSLPPGPSCMR
jgi:hypothetical protein